MARAARQAPRSDPAPRPTAARQPATEQGDWRPAAAEAVTFPLHDLTVVDADGFPSVSPVTHIEQTSRGFRVQTASGITLPASGPACLTAHTHDVPFTSQQNRTFVGRLSDSSVEAPEIEVERLLPHWSIPSGKLASAVSFIRAGRRLRQRLADESGRRGQRPPKVRLPQG